MVSTMSVIPFGISSGRPTATRHVSGLALDLGGRWILVDCGEGTQQQVMRSPLRLSRLDAVLLTHLHGDHVLGLPGLLGTLGMEQRTRELTVIGPVGVRRWLEVMLDLPILGLTFDLRLIELPTDPNEGRIAARAGPVDDRETGPDGRMAPKTGRSGDRVMSEIAKRTVATDGSELIDLGSVSGLRTTVRRLRHRVPSFGFRFEEPERAGRVDVARARSLGLEPGPALGRLQAGETVEGIRPDQVIGPPRRGRVVTVLGDTSRSHASVLLARDADLLVHECTYAAAEHDLCERWTHSCSTDVASVATESGARHVLIDHFSARHPDPEVLAQEVRDHLGEAATRVTAAVEGEPVPVDHPDPAPTTGEAG